MIMQGSVNGRRDKDDFGQGNRQRNTCDTFLRGLWCNHTPAVRLVVALPVILLLPLAAGAENGRGYLEMSGGYKTGDFGTPIRTNLYYIAPALGYVSAAYDVSVTMPYLFLKNSGGSQTEMMV